MPIQEEAPFLTDEMKQVADARGTLSLQDREAEIRGVRAETEEQIAQIEAMLRMPDVPKLERMSMRQLLASLRARLEISQPL